jgi:hypothetical protein
MLRLCVTLIIHVKPCTFPNVTLCRPFRVHLRGPTHVSVSVRLCFSFGLFCQGPFCHGPLAHGPFCHELFMTGMRQHGIMFICFLCALCRLELVIITQSLVAKTQSWTIPKIMHVTTLLMVGAGRMMVHFYHGIVLSCPFFSFSYWSTYVMKINAGMLSLLECQIVTTAYRILIQNQS